ncbi:MAG: 16S rRNA (cytidine(1402)-2'-O)-methyltransferase [Candidatus Levybacteria bacterium]|nr:16S rRNA (cytidine(1402)-2'-O)-methyltransferase [Candidatus Levybacteria bacterium]
MGTLFVVATPVGNLKDITLRAIEILFSVDGIACEDTRKTGFLLRSVAPQKPSPRLISYYEQNEQKRIPEIITALKNGINIALVSDAGTPTISDPGFKLVRQCVQEGIRVESIPGPSSVISALVASGLPTDQFFFFGFPPHKEGKRKKLFLNVLQSFEPASPQGGTSKQIHPTIVFFVAPHSLLKILLELQDVFGDINIVIARELTKLHEEIRREQISQSLNHFTNTNPKGEFVVLFNLAEQESSPLTR